MKLPNVIHNISHISLHCLQISVENKYKYIQTDKERERDVQTGLPLLKIQQINITAERPATLAVVLKQYFITTKHAPLVIRT